MEFYTTNCRYSEDDDLPEGVKDFRFDSLQIDKSESDPEYFPSSSSSSDSDASSDFEDKVKIVYSTTREARHTDGFTLTTGTNTSKTRELKPSTMYCYLNNFHNFWKWLNSNHPDIIYFKPPEKSPRTFNDISYDRIFPIDFKKLTPEIFFEYIGTNDRDEYSPIVGMVKQSLRYVAMEYGKKSDYLRLMVDIKNKEKGWNSGGVKRVFRRDRFKKSGVKQTTARPPPAKRQPEREPNTYKIIDDDKTPNPHVVPAEATVPPQHQDIDYRYELECIKNQLSATWQHVDAIIKSLDIQPIPLVEGDQDIAVIKIL